MTGYGEYLQLDTLLTLQHPRSERADELVFIVAHQVYELWFKLIVTDLRGASNALERGQISRAVGRLGRVRSLEHLMVEQLALLDTMNPYDFLRIRGSLLGASGAESEQFARIEALSRKTFPGRDGAEPDLWTAFCRMVALAGLPMPSETDERSYERRQATLTRMYTGSGRLEDLRAVAEALLDHDAGFALWRYRHYLTACRQIGERPGTGGTAGCPYLKRHLDRRFYPELWDVRTSLPRGTAGACNGTGTPDRKVPCPGIPAP